MVCVFDLLHTVFIKHCWNIFTVSCWLLLLDEILFGLSKISEAILPLNSALFWYKKKPEVSKRHFWVCGSGHPWIMKVKVKESILPVDIKLQGKLHFLSDGCNSGWRTYLFKCQLQVCTGSSLTEKSDTKGITWACFYFVIFLKFSITFRYEKSYASKPVGKIL